ncbi:MAG TPA: hypothetical protein VIH61_07290, partial [Waddliaceae bacterium]
PDEDPAARNSFLISGYIPIIGIIAGLTHICEAKHKKMGLLSKVGLVARGVIECLGGGLLFLIPDLIVTMHRFFCTSRPPLGSSRVSNNI